MFARVRDFFRRFFNDPLGTAVEAGLYLVFLAVGVWILVFFAKMAWTFIKQAIDN
jgi:hypothetical protein